MATTHPVESRADQATRLRLYRTMVECRFFEQRAQELFFEGLVRGTTHLGIGQEAVAAGFSAARIEEEVVVTADGPRVITKFPSDELFVANAY